MKEWAAWDEVKEDDKYLWVELMVRKPHFLGSVLILGPGVRLGLEDWWQRWTDPGHSGRAQRGPHAENQGNSMSAQKADFAHHARGWDLFSNEEISVRICKLLSAGKSI